MSKNIQSGRKINCDLPMQFWKNVLHQLSNRVNLHSMWLRNMNTFKIELDKLLTNL